MLIGDAHRVRSHPLHRSGDQIDDRRHLLLRELAAIGQPQHHRGGRRDGVAHKHRFIALGDLHPHRLDAIDLLDRQHQFMLARRQQAFAFERAAGAHRQLVERIAAGVGAGQRPILCNQHPRLVEIAVIDGQRAAVGIDAVMDLALVERGDHTGALGIVELGVKQALRRRGEQVPAQRGATERGHADKPGQRSLYRGLGHEALQADQRRAGGNEIVHRLGPPSA